eukprot:5547315-Lingulodinium_polyedra.AAC.1
MVEDSISEDDSVLPALQEATRALGVLPLVYWERPVGKEHGSEDNPVLPLAMFVDAAVVGRWLVNI